MPTSRRSDDQVREFDAPPGLSQNLQQVLVDLVELHLQGKGDQTAAPSRRLPLPPPGIF